MNTLALGEVLAAHGRILQIAPEFNEYPLADEEIAMAIEVARLTGCTLTYSLKQTNGDPDGWRGPDGPDSRRPTRKA